VRCHHEEPLLIPEDEDVVAFLHKQG